MNVTCSAPVCPVILNSSCVFYEGESLIYTGINTNDSLQVALQKIDAALGLTTVVNIYNSDGVLTGNRTVSMNSFSLSFEKDVYVHGVRVGRGGGSIGTNTVVGDSSLVNNTTGTFNTAVGIGALDNNTVGNYNTGIGAYSLTNVSSGEGNTGVGTSSMTFLTTGYSNTALGYGALYNATTGFQNIGVGRSSLYNLTSGSENIGIGLSTGSSITTGIRNTIVGHVSGQSLSTGNSNTIIGANVSGLAPTTSNNIILSDGDGNIQFKDDGANTILPRLAGVGTRLVVTNATGALSTQPIPTGNITGSGSLGQVAFFTGASSIGGNSTLYWDSFNGRLGVGTNIPNRTLTVSGSFAVTGGNISLTNTITDGDIVIGSTNFLQMGSTRFRGNGTDFEFKDSGTNTTRALIATGTNVSYFNSGGNYHFGGTSDDGTNRLQVTGSAKITSDSTINDISIGKGGGSIATNTRVGTSALSANTTGTSNVAFGNSSMFNNTTGINNVVVGTEALYTSTIGSNNNVIVGRQAAYYCTAIVDSIAIGAAALSNALNSQRNVAIGRQSMINSVSGNDNTALGYRALYGAASSTYANNTGIGSGALGNMLSGGNNTAIGFESGAYAPTAGNNNTTSTNSIYVGYRAGASANGNTNEIIIGYDTAGNGSNTATLGNSSTVGTYLRGKTILAASVAARASLNITTGVAPTTPTDGDVWSTTTDLLARIGGTTYSLINSGPSGSGAAGQVTFWSSASGLTGSATLQYTPTTQLLVNNSVTTSAGNTNIKGVHVTSTLNATASGDVMTGLYLNPSFNNGIFSVTNYALYAIGDSFYDSTSLASLTVQGSNTNWAGFRIKSTAAGGRSYMLASSASSSTLGNSNFSILDETAGQPRLTINSSGFLGLMKASAGYPLDLSNNSAALGALSSGGNVNVSAHLGNGLYVGVQSTTSAIVFAMFSQQQPFIWAGWNGTTIAERMRLTQSSNLLIGGITDDGINRLQVNGNAKLTGILNITGSITAASTIARGQYIDNTLIASANNDILSGLDIRPTFNVGAFTGVGRFGIRIVSSTGVICYAVNMLDGNHIFGDASGNARLGINSTGGGSSSIAIANPGGTNSASGPSAISIGTNTAGGQNTISIGGSNTNAGEYNIAIGTNQTCNGTSSIVIGRSRTGHNFCIALGHGNGGVGTTSANQFIAATITEVYFGNGVRPFSGNAISYLISGSGGSGNDTNGGNVTIGGGRGTGIGTPGDVIFSTTNLQTTGGTEQTRVDRWWVKGATGQFANVASPNASAIMQADSTTRGFLPPRMTVAQRTAIASPAEGLIVFQTDDVIGLYVYANAAWRSLTMV